MHTYLEESLQRDINRIRSKVIDMGTRAEMALKSSLQALEENNRQIAYSVILRDRYIDELEQELDRLCQEFLVRQQPAGGHLRFVYATIKINNELERIGDYAESIARQYLVISSLDPAPSHQKIVDIANLTLPMLRNAIQAFTDQDESLARATMEMEDQVDNIRSAIHNDLVHLRDQKKLPLEALAPLMIIASRYERAADQVCNICEEVLYMCTGENIKHKGREVFRVLFVDSDNACLSQMAEGIANSLKLDRFLFSSAGLSPAKVDQKTVDFLKEKNIDISTQTAKYLNQILNLEHYEIIIALSKDAEEILPDPPTKTIGICWDIQNPAVVQGAEETARAVYEKSYKYLNMHIRDLVQAVLGYNHFEEEEK